MKDFFLNYLGHKDLYPLAISLGGTVSYIVSLFSEHSDKELFGISITLWFIAFIINLLDIKTGIAADKVRKEKEGKKFSFESNRGWRAIEKIVLFTIIISFLHHSHLECIKNKFPELVGQSLLSIKFIAFFYVIILEIKSIGENDETRFGKKGNGFIFLDKVIEVLSDGILENIKKLLGMKKEEKTEIDNNNNNEPIG